MVNGKSTFSHSTLTILHYPLPLTHQKMENANLSKGHESARASFNALANEINAACASLLDTLSLNPTSVATHGIVISNKLGSEFVDRIVNNISLLKLHLTDLEKNLNSGFFKSERVEEIAGSLIETSDRLNEFLLSNNFYMHTFEWSIKEVEHMIEKVLNKMPIGMYRFHD